MTQQAICKLLSNAPLGAEYRRAVLEAGGIAATAAPGQFVHLQLNGLDGHLLRRPFSICDATPDGRLVIVYKVVGTGTAHLAQCRPGLELDLIGPLGRGFTAPSSGRHYVLVAGGYGCAAMYFTARLAAGAGAPPQVLLGARTAADLLLEEDFASLGCPVETATNDGSRGHRGLITELLAETLKRHPDAAVAACGPMPMLKAVAALCEQFTAASCQVSLDEMMCCGMGACFGCVVKCRDDSAAGWCYRRSCKDGPVFDAREIYWE